MNYLEIDGIPIEEQLHLEEYLLAKDAGNWCIVNKGSSQPTIVLGISAKAEEWIERSVYDHHPFLILQRFTGGGTVVVDENTLFITFLINGGEFDLLPIPQKLLEWTAPIYEELFPLSPRYEPFQIRENDYTFGSKKTGGNAQYFKKERYLHHTSFLMSYDPIRMKYLRKPPRQPVYRGERSHLDFLTTLSEAGFEKSGLIGELKKILDRRFELDKRSDEEDLLSLTKSWNSFRTHRVIF